MSDEQTKTRCDRLRQNAPLVLGVLVQQDMVWAADEIPRLKGELAKLQAVVDAALAWDAEMFNEQIWHETERDLHDALAPFRARGGEL